MYYSFDYFLVSFLCFVISFNVSYFFEFSLRLSVLLINVLSILITIFENFASGLCLGLLLEFCPVLSFGIYFFVSSFQLSLCVCLYVLGRSATSPSLGRLALCSRYPVASVVQCACSHKLGASRVSLVWVVCALLLWLSHACVGTSVHEIDSQDGLNYIEQAIVQRLTPQSCICFSEALVPSESTLWACHLCML